MVREPKEVWEERVMEWRRSGLSAKKFAAQIGVNCNTLTGWGARLERGRRRPKRTRGTKTVVPAQSSALTFLEVGTSRAPESKRFEIELSSGRRVSVPADFDAQSLARLLQVLEIR